MNNSQMSFYTTLCLNTYHDVVGAMIPQSEKVRDTTKIVKRAQSEGIDFFTSTLPSLGKSIDLSLSTGAVLGCTGFRSKVGTKLPCFMHSCFRLLFRDDGVPWFATWYYDLALSALRHYAWWSHDHYFDKAEGLYEKCRDDCLRLSLQHDYRLNSLFFKIIKGLIERDGHPAFLPSVEEVVKVQPFPGLDILRELGFASYEVDAIARGIYDPAKTLIDDSRLSRHKQSPLCEEMAVALRGMRQVSFLFYKLDIPYDEEKNQKVIDSFVQTDSSLPREGSGAYDDDPITKIARRIIARVLCGGDPLSGNPKHGPGAVATGESPGEKHCFKRYYERLARVYPYDQWFYLNSSHIANEKGYMEGLESREAGTAKVVLVPKDSRGPRLISCEPLEYQWIQQAQMSVLVNAIEEHPLTEGRVNFTDQLVNRTLALVSSMNYLMVTLDMKDASDRVSLELVRTLFPRNWYEALYASRSPSTQLPNGNIVHMNKFAPMGSAVCFPVEALVFWAISVASIMHTHGLSLLKASTKVYVYGDDIVCSTAYHGCVVQALPRFGLMLNANKCCIAGPFKESCGQDALFGYPVSVTKIRHQWSPSLKSSDLASYVDYSNEFYRQGHLRSASYLSRVINRSLRAQGRHVVPYSSGNPSCIAFVREDLHCETINKRIRAVSRLNKSLQRKEHLGYALVPKLEIAKEEGYALLLRLLAAMKDVKEDDAALAVSPACKLPTGHYPIAHRNKLKRAWTPAGL